MRSQWMVAILLAAAMAAMTAMARPALARPTPVPVIVSGSSGAGEEIQLDLSPEVSFEIYGSGAVAARSPFLVSIRRAQIAPGKALRISVSLDAAAAPGTRLSFQPSGSHGGVCRAGSLLPGVSVQIFESTGNGVTGSCELRWKLDSLIRPRQAGTIPLTLHWKLESVAVSGSMARAPGAGDTLEGGGASSAGSHRPSSVDPAGGERQRDIERPERRRPPS